MPRRIVIVDDEEYIRIPMQDYFEDCGWDVSAFNSGEDALAYLEVEEADCVIIDMRLPGMTGLEFIDRAGKIRGGMRFVIYTGSVGFNITENLLKAGITQDCIVHKPAENLSELLKAAEGKGCCGE